MYLYIMKSQNMVSSLFSIMYEPNYCGLWAIVYGLTYWVNWTNYANKLCLTTKWSHIMYKHTIIASFTYTYPCKVFQQVWLCLRNIHSHSIKITKNTYYHKPHFCMCIPLLKASTHITYFMLCCWEVYFIIPPSPPCFWGSYIVSFPPNYQNSFLYVALSYLQPDQTN